MNLNELLTYVEKMEEKAQSVSQTKLDLTLFNYTNLTRTMIMSVHDQLFLDPSSTPSIEICRITNLTEKQQLTLEQKQIIISSILTKLENESFDSSIQSYVFQVPFILEKDRLRHVTNGPITRPIISKKTEEQVFSLYKYIFHYQLQRYFQLISSENYFLKILPFMLELFHIKETRFSKQDPGVLVDFVFLDIQHLSEEGKEEAQTCIKHAFKHTNRAFLIPTTINKLSIISQYLFLYSDEEKQMILSTYKPILEKEVEKLTDEINHSENFGFPVGFSDPYIARKFKTLKQNIHQLQLLET